VRVLVGRNPKLAYIMSVYSAYFDGLSVEDKLNYRKKLILTEGNVLPDPLALKEVGQVMYLFSPMLGGLICISTL